MNNQIKKKNVIIFQMYFINFITNYSIIIYIS